jgi:Tfp pilus assembly protein PilO
MKQLPPKKRNQLAIVLICAAGLIVLVYIALIQPQNDLNRELKAKTNAEIVRLQQMKSEIKEMDATTSTLAEWEQQLHVAEQDLVSGDPFAWAYDTLRHFNKSSYHVDIPTVSQPTLGNVNLPPQFPYRQVKFSLNGTAQYQDLGRFIADFENKFPHIRLNNLTLEPSSTPDGGAAERLDFRIDILALTRSNP